MTHIEHPSNRPHLEVLDGLRGWGAFTVVAFHLYEFIIPAFDFTKMPIGHGFLIVDFFFCLSGFIMGYAYDERALAKTAKSFLQLRLIRLHPMVLWGSIFGLTGYVWNPFTGLELAREAGWTGTIIAFITSSLMLPYPFVPGRLQSVFPLNSPAWTLFIEYVLTVIYIFLLLKLSSRKLLVLLLIAGPILSVVAGYRGWITFGWNAPTFPDGFSRGIFSFLSGLAIFRFNLIIKNRGGFFLPAALLSIILFFPHRENDWMIEFAGNYINHTPDYFHWGWYNCQGLPATLLLICRQDILSPLSDTYVGRLVVCVLCDGFSS